MCLFRLWSVCDFEGRQCLFREFPQTGFFPQSFMSGGAFLGVSEARCDDRHGPAEGPRVSVNAWIEACTMGDDKVRTSQSGDPVLLAVIEQTSRAHIGEPLVGLILSPGKIAAAMECPVLHAELAPRSTGLPSSGSKGTAVMLPRSARGHLSQVPLCRRDVLERRPKPSILTMVDPAQTSSRHQTESIRHRICAIDKRRYCPRPISVTTEISRSLQ